MAYFTALKLAVAKAAVLSGRKPPLWTRIPTIAYIAGGASAIILIASMAILSAIESVPNTVLKCEGNLQGSFNTGGSATLGDASSAGFTGSITEGCSVKYGNCPGATFPNINVPSSTKVVFPYPGGTSVGTSGFGYRTHPVTGGKSFHAGGDIAATGPFNSVADGTVVDILDTNNGDSPYITVKHNINGRTWFSSYLHWDHPIHVKVGDTVKAGQPLATTGTRGPSTGIHLHIEIGDGGVNNVIDPNTFFHQHGAISDYVPDGSGGNIFASESANVCGGNGFGGFLTDGARKAIIEAAHSQLGVKYVWGGQVEGQEFDCSGLTQWAYRKAGVEIPRTADQQWKMVERIPKDQAKPGDLAFLIEGNDHAYHVGIYIGDGKIIHAPQPGDVVKIDSDSGYLFGRPPGLPEGEGGGTPEANKALAKTMMSPMWNDPQQFTCLSNLWHRESSWNHLAVNPSSGAYGIPQSLPADKMASEGADYKTNPATQIRWGLRYIKERYGSPCSAWAHSERVGWY